MFGIGVLPSTNKPPRPFTAIKKVKVKEEKEIVKIKRPQSSRVRENNSSHPNLFLYNSESQDINKNFNRTTNDSDNCITNMIQS